MEPLIGTIIQFAGNFAPRGWMLCDGTLLAISQNAALFSILGTTYGGDGVTTFALPDLRGRVCIHVGQGPGLSPYSLGESGGTENVTLLVNNMPAHSHSYNAAETGDGVGAPNGNALGKTPANIYTTNPPNVAMNALAIGSTGGSQPFSVRQPYLAINWLIATEGVYPSRP
jgi:microcystin-dependent protein